MVHCSFCGRIEMKISTTCLVIGVRLKYPAIWGLLAMPVHLVLIELVIDIKVNALRLLMGVIDIYSTIINGCMHR